MITSVSSGQAIGSIEVAAEIRSIAETKVAAMAVTVSRTEVNGVDIGYPLGISVSNPTTGSDANINARGVPTQESRCFSVPLRQNNELCWLKAP
jgi:hypothetical protein